MAAKRKKQAPQSKKNQTKSNVGVVYGFVFLALLLASIVFGIYLMSKPETVPSTTAVNGHSVLTDPNALSMHGVIVAIDGTKITFIDDNGDTRSIMQDNPIGLFVGQTIHFNYFLDAEGELVPIPNTVGGH